MKLSKELRDEITRIKIQDNLSTLNYSMVVISILEKISELCDGAGETQWTIKDQIQIAIEELNN